MTEPHLLSRETRELLAALGKLSSGAYTIFRQAQADREVRDGGQSNRGRQ